MEFIDKIKNTVNNKKTYQIGLIQAKAYRLLNQKTSMLLKKYSLSSVQWAMLGLLYDNQKGLKLAVVAEELGVKAPFVTRMFQDLTRLHLVESAEDPTDSRAKIICLSRSGRKFTEQTEKHMRKEMRPLLQGASLHSIMGYVHVLQKIIDNYKD